MHMKQPSPWIPLLQGLNLSRTDRDLVTRFGKNPGSRLFLPVAKILKAHNLVDESLELLSQGVASHPDYAAARVSLCCELFDRGVFDDAWHLLEVAIASLKENVTAQRLRLKLAIVLAKEFDARETLEHLKRRDLLGDDLSPLAAAIRTVEFSRLVASVRAQLRASGIPMDEPSESSPKDSGVPLDLSDAQSFLASTSTLELGIHYDSSFLASLSGYQMMSLDELRNLSLCKASWHDSSDPMSTQAATLAEIYENQGFEAKSLKIYQDLLEKNPDSQFLKQKIALLSSPSSPPLPKSDLESLATQLSKKSAANLASQMQLDESIAYLQKVLKAVEASP